jgi:hypothetical protein
MAIQYWIAKDNLVATRSFDVGLRKTTWWPPGHSMLDCERQLGGHQIVQCWIAKDNLVATKSFNVGLCEITWWPPCHFLFLLGDLVATKSSLTKLQGTT